MKITSIDEQFSKNLEFQFHNRREYVMLCLDYIESIDDLHAPNIRVVPCSENNDRTFFVYNQVCKVYFEVDPETNGIILKNFVFANHDV